MRIVVTGLIGQYAFGGVTWDYIQYALGFRSLGHDVWYLEDTGTWAYDPVKMEPSADCSRNTAYLARVMEARTRIPGAFRRKRPSDFRSSSTGRLRPWRWAVCSNSPARVSH